MSEILFALNGFGDTVWLLRTYGPLLVAVIFFLWRDWKREDRLSNRINELEEEQRNVILPLVKECTVVITRNTKVMEQNTKVMTRLEQALDRPFCRHPADCPLSD